MEKMEIEETYIIRCLSGYADMLEDVRERIGYLNTNMTTADDVIRNLQVKARQYGQITPGSSGKHRDLGDLLEQYEKNERAYNHFLKEHISQLITEEEAIRRIWVCFQSLPYEQRRVLTELYVKKKPWKAVECDLQMSHSTVSNHRNSGLLNIKKLYDSDFSNLQVIALKKYEKPKPAKQDSGEQLSLWQMGVKKP